MIKEIVTKNIQDKNVKDALIDLNTSIRNDPFTSSEFKFYVLELKQAVTEYKVRHGQSFIPTDIIQTSAIGPGVITWLYSKFDKEYIYLTTTDAVTVRFLAGRFKG
jgi:hypothetical protein